MDTKPQKETTGVVVNRNESFVQREKIAGVLTSLNRDIKYILPESDPIIAQTFLTESSFKASRQELKTALEIFLELLENVEQIESFVQNCEKVAEDAEKYLQENIGKLEPAVLAIHKPIRELDVYYKNTGQEKLEDLTILAFDEKKLENDPDDELFKALDNEVSPRYNAIDKSQSVGYIVCPKFPGSILLSRLADLAYKNKTTFVTAYRDLESVELTMEFLEKDKIGGPELKFGNVVVLGNTIISKEGMNLSPAASFGGKMYVTRMSQPAAGLLHGTMEEVAAIRYNVSVPELELFKKNGIVPLANGFKADMTYGTWTTYNGDNDNLKQFAIVRVLNWIDRSICHNLNKYTHILTERRNLAKVNSQVAAFLDQVKANRLIEDGKVTLFEQDRKIPDKINIKFKILPLFAVRLFEIIVDASKETDASSEVK